MRSWAPWFATRARRERVLDRIANREPGVHTVARPNGVWTVSIGKPIPLSPKFMERLGKGWMD